MIERLFPNAIALAARADILKLAREVELHPHDPVTAQALAIAVSREFPVQPRPEPVTPAGSAGPRRWRWRWVTGDGVSVSSWRTTKPPVDREILFPNGSTIRVQVVAIDFSVGGAESVGG